MVDEAYSVAFGMVRRASEGSGLWRGGKVLDRGDAGQRKASLPPSFLYLSKHYSNFPNQELLGDTAE